MGSTEEALTLEELARVGETYEPRQRVIAFARRYGSAHAALALYASLPLGLTPDLVHLLRVNFVASAPWIAEADLLLSPLCREAGGDFYEMDARVREFLLDEFVADENFGVARLRRAAEFLYVYAGRARMAARRRDARAFWQAQEWTALAYARSDEAARVLASELGRKINEVDAGEALRVARVANTLASPLGAHDELVLYAAGFERMLSGGEGEEVFELFDAAGANDAALNIAGVNLPSTQELATRLGLQTPTAPTPAPQPQTQTQPQTRTQSHAAEKNPRGFTLTQTFKTGGGYVTRLAWSPDGKFLAAPATDSNIYAWEAEVGGTHILQAHEGIVREVAWSPDGKRLAAITDRKLLTWQDIRLRSYEPDNRQLLLGPLRSVAWSPDGRTLIAANASGVLLLPPTGRPHQLFDEKGINFVTWLPTETGRTFAFASLGGDVGLCTVRGARVERFMERLASVLSLAASPDGQLLASGRRDGVISIWDVSSRRRTAALEGHTTTLEGYTGAVSSLSFSADGRLLASKSEDGTVRLWRTDTWETVAVLDEPANDATLDSGIAFHPQHSDTLATLDETGRGVRIWRLDVDLLTGRVREEGDIYYKNADVLLVGDPASWKTDLAQRLIEKGLPAEARSQPTPTTRSLGRRQLYEERVPLQDGRTEVREVTLIDLPGALTEQVSGVGRPADISLALLVFNPSYEGLYSIVEHCDAELRRALEIHGKHVRSKRFLVLPRADFESVAEVKTRPGFKLLLELNFDGHFWTSTTTDEGVDELLGAIREAIDWDAVTGVAMPKLFDDVKTFVNEVKREDLRLVRVEELLRAFQASENAPPDLERADFEAALQMFESFGLLRLLDFGGLALLRPEEFESATNALISRLDEKGYLPERTRHDFG